VAHSHEGRQLLLKCLAFCAKGEPEIEGARYRSFHLVFREHPSGIGDGGAFLPSGAIGVGGGAEAIVHLAGILAGEGQDLGFELLWGRRHTGGITTSSKQIKLDAQKNSCKSSSSIVSFKVRRRGVKLLNLML